MFENNTYENLKNRILSNIDLPLQKNEGSILDSWAGGTALSHADFYSALETIYNYAFIQNLEGENLDIRLREFEYYRKQGAMACGELTVYGQDGYEIVDGTLFSYKGHFYEAQGRLDKYIIRDGQVDVFVTAREIGTNSNILKNEELQLVEQTDKVTRVITKEHIQNGENKESDADFRSRFFYMQAHKGTSGNIDDYRNWALEVDGVKTVKVVPLWKGAGTVKVLVMGDNNRNVDGDVVKTAQTHIDRIRPIGANVTVTTPSVREINVTATVEYDNYVGEEEVKKDFKERLNQYLFNASEEITYTKVGAILSEIEGVKDYKDLKINSQSKNIKLGAEEIGSVGTVELIKGEVI